MKQIVQWCQREQEKLQGRSLRECAEYLWGYYQLWIIALVCVLLLLPMGIHHYFTTNSECWFFSCFANTTARLGPGTDFYNGFAEYAGYDLNEKDLLFVDQCYCDPNRKLVGNQYYQLLITYLDSGELDTLVMEPEYLQTIGASGRLMDLRDNRTASLFEKYHDRLIFSVPLEEKNGSEAIPIGIDLTGSILTEQIGAYPMGAALGINALSPHPEEAAAFLSYLFASAGDNPSTH